MAAPADTLNPPTVTTTNWAPTAKVSAGILAASVTTLLVSLWNKATTNFALGASEATALTTMITFAIQYLVPERK